SAAIKEDPNMKFLFAGGILLFALAVSAMADEDLASEVQQFKDMALKERVEEENCTKYVLAGGDCEIVIRMEKLENILKDFFQSMTTKPKLTELFDASVSYFLGGQCFCSSLEVKGCHPFLVSIIDAVKEQCPKKKQ
ncbi:hypothetical protein, partial [Escherichia coli]